MSKPILSELEYNASDVASAILAAADLSVTNEDFAVSEVKDDFTLQTGWTATTKQMFTFNGFMFISSHVVHYGDVPDPDEVIYINSNTETRPSENYSFPALGLQGDLANNIVANSSGDIFVSNPEGSGDASWQVSFNAWYRY